MLRGAGHLWVSAQMPARRDRGLHREKTSKGTGKQPIVSFRANKFGKLLRERRRLLDLTQEELASRIRVSMPFVGHLETGHRRPSEKQLQSLRKVLGLEQQEFFLLANPGTRAFFSHSQD
jgi:ribosome-binding protein aMBF1 (putative translation factor)